MRESIRSLLPVSNAATKSAAVRTCIGWSRTFKMRAAFSLSWLTNWVRRATDAQVLEDAECLIVAWNERQAKRGCRTTNAIDLRTPQYSRVEFPREIFCKMG